MVALPPPGSRASAGDNNPFLLHVVVQSELQGVKAKVLFPQFLLNHGRDIPHHESRCGSRLPEMPENPTQCSLEERFNFSVAKCGCPFGCSARL